MNISVTLRCSAVVDQLFARFSIMGISALLPFLSDVTSQVNIATFTGQTAAVDGYCWLHKGAVLCAEDLIFRRETTV